MATTSANAVTSLLPQDGTMLKNDWSDDRWQEPQKKTEGRGWADMNATTADNTYTGKVGSKRD
jgi:hypothetical protein